MRSVHGKQTPQGAAGLCCLSDRLGAAIVAVADGDGMESAEVLSEAGSAAEPSD